jgi:hypothetical protein
LESNFLKRFLLLLLLEKIVELKRESNSTLLGE